MVLRITNVTGNRMAWGIGAATLLLTLAGAAHAAAWSYQELKDPITDAARGIAVLEGDGGRLVIKCDSNGANSMYAQLIADKFLGSLQSNERGVISRFDEATPETQNWYHDGRNAVLVDNHKTVVLVNNFVGAKKIVFRLTNYQGEAVDIVLTEDGNVDAIKKAFATCGQAWPQASH